MITFEQIKQNKTIQTYIEKADEVMLQMGYTEHSYAHVSKVADSARYILSALDFSQREIELAQIAGYMHDIGNLINRDGHAQSGANMAFSVLSQLNAAPEDIGVVISAIGNHDESAAYPVNGVTAALILGDKCDVRYTRVRNPDTTAFDIHDRVNYAVKKSYLKINEEKTNISLFLQINTEECSVMDYFEIFLNRMLLCRKAAEKLGLQFQLIVNQQRLL